MNEYAAVNNEVANCTTFEVSENGDKSCQEWVTNGHQLNWGDIEDLDKEANEDSDQERPTSAITTYSEAIKLGNDMLTFFQSREEELANRMFTIIQKV